MNISKLRNNIFFYPILYLVSLVYRLITDIRNILYDVKIFKSISFSKPIISIGNLTVGGTGKTPFTIFLVQKLIMKFPKIAVVSRGYARKTKGVVLVSDGAGKIVSADIGGDEPVLIASKFKNIIVIASEDRCKGIQLAIEKFGVDLVLLDDAFQHRKVDRDCDIVLINAQQKLLEDKILPLGNLREKIGNLDRANIGVFTKIENNSKNSAREIVKRKFKIPFYETKFAAGDVFNRSLKHVSGIDAFNSTHVIAFAGIADPWSFKSTLQAQGIIIDEFISFKDHQKYGSQQFIKIEQAAHRNKCKTILTTEKDILKFSDMDLSDLDIFAIGLGIEVFDEEKFLKKIYPYIDSI